jgi:hypothetical protein
LSLIVYTDYNEEEEDSRIDDNDVKDNNYLKDLDYIKVNPKVIKEPFLDDHYIIRIFKQFCNRLARPIFPPNHRILDCFLYWLANNLGYKIGTVGLARYVLQDYLKESGYNLTAYVRDELRKTVL